MTTTNEDRMFGSEFLQEIIEWIGNNLAPENVFSEADLIVWARAWAEHQEEWIPDPDAWALENGYVKE